MIGLDTVWRILVYSLFDVVQCADFPQKLAASSPWLLLCSDDGSSKSLKCFYQTALRRTPED